MYIKLVSQLKTLFSRSTGCTPIATARLHPLKYNSQIPSPQATCYLIRTERYRNWVNNARDPWFTTPHFSLISYGVVKPIPSFTITREIDSGQYSPLSSSSGQFPTFLWGLDTELLIWMKMCIHTCPSHSIHIFLHMLKTVTKPQLTEHKTSARCGWSTWWSLRWVDSRFLQWYKINGFFCRWARCIWQTNTSSGSTMFAAVSSSPHTPTAMYPGDASPLLSSWTSSCNIPVPFDEYLNSEALVMLASWQPQNTEFVTTAPKAHPGQ